MRIRKEARGVGLDLSECEARSGVHAIRQDSCGEWTGHAPHGAAELIIADGVRKCDAWGSGGAEGSLVDVGRCFGGGLVGAGYAEESDVLDMG